MTPRAEGLLPRSQGLKAEHPCWGDRRLWPYWHGVEGWSVKNKRGRRVVWAPHLGVTPNPQLQAKRPPCRSQPQPTTPQEWWGSDMTKGRVDGFGWVYLVLVWDWYTPKSVGYDEGCPVPPGIGWQLGTWRSAASCQRALGTRACP